MYKQVCIVCQEEFISDRVNGVMCGKKCRNKARYLPKDLLARLRRRNSSFTIPLENTNLQKTNPVIPTVVGVSEAEINEILKAAIETGKRQKIEERIKRIEQMERDEKLTPEQLHEKEIETAKQEQTKEVVTDLSDIM
jgi:undecaprenyl pyrophosphate synthase